MNPAVTPMRNELEDWLPMQNIARNQCMLRKPGSPTPYEEERRQNIARNEEMLRKLFEDNSPLCSPLPSPKRQKVGKSETPGETALVILRSPGGNSRGKQILTPYEEERRQNIARNQEVLRSIMGPVGPTKYTRGQESAGTASETPGETALVILRSPAGNTERALGGAWGTPAAFVQSLARCGMSLNPAAVN